MASARSNPDPGECAMQSTPGAIQRLFPWPDPPTINAINVCSEIGRGPSYNATPNSRGALATHEEFFFSTIFGRSKDLCMCFFIATDICSTFRACHTIFSNPGPKPCLQLTLRITLFLQSFLLSSETTAKRMSLDMMQCNRP